VQPVPVDVLVLVLVLVLVAGVHVHDVFPTTQASTAIRAVKQVDPDAAYVVAQVASQVVAVASQGHFNWQFMKSAQGLPVKLPLAKLLPKAALY
jgi:hypothetical protein